MVKVWSRCGQGVVKMHHFPTLGTSRHKRCGAVAQDFRQGGRVLQDLDIALSSVVLCGLFFVSLVAIVAGKQCLLVVIMAAVSLPLLKGRVSLEEALDSDTDMLQRLSYHDKREQFYGSAVFDKLPEIRALVSRHLRVPQSAFKIGVINDRGYNEWIHGSFNLCVPIYILQPCKNLPSKLYIRFPLPYRVGEEHYPGNAEEKLRCEAATYIWM